MLLESGSFSTTATELYLIYSGNQQNSLKMSNNLTPVSRADRDVLDLILEGYEVKYLVDSPTHNGTAISVTIHGPTGSIHEGGVWKVRLVMTEDYPFKYPYISFINRIFHPNIDFLSGRISLHDLDDQWTSICNLTTILGDILPNLLQTPLCSHPYILNQEASALYIMNTDVYETTVKKHILEYASEDEEIDVVGLDDDDFDALSFGSAASTLTVPSWIGDFYKEKIERSKIEQTEVDEKVHSNSEEYMEFENQEDEVTLQATGSMSPIQIINENGNDLWYEPPLKRRKYQ